MIQAMAIPSHMPPAQASDSHNAGERTPTSLMRATASRRLLQSNGGGSSTSTSTSSDAQGPTATEECQPQGSREDVTLLLLMAFIGGVITMGLGTWCFAVCSHGEDYNPDKLYSSSRTALFAPHKVSDLHPSATGAPPFTDSRHGDESQVGLWSVCVMVAWSDACAAPW